MDFPFKWLYTLVKETPTKVLKKTESVMNVEIACESIYCEVTREKQKLKGYKIGIIPPLLAAMIIIAKSDTVHNSSN